MADWSKITSRGNIEDRRGSPLAVAGGGLSLFGVGVILLINLLSGGKVDVGGVLNQLPQATGQSSYTSKDFEGVDDYERFTSTVLGSTNDTWTKIFEASGRHYQEPKLVLYSQGRSMRQSMPLRPSVMTESKRRYKDKYILKRGRMVHQNSGCVGLTLALRAVHRQNATR